MTRLNSEELWNQLKEQVELLEVNCKVYDEGKNVAIKSIATNIRVLVHDTARSTSLLTLNNIKNSLKVKDDVEPDLPGNLLTFIPLTMMHISTGQNEGGYVPRLGNGRPRQIRNVSVDEWLEEVVLHFKKEDLKFTRHQLIDLFSNKMGGAHVDKDIPNHYYLLDKNQLGYEWFFAVDGIEYPMKVNGPHFASVRHMAYELLEPLKEFLNK